MYQIALASGMAFLILVGLLYLFFIKWSVSIPDYMAARHYRFGKPTTSGPISGKRVVVIPGVDHLVLIDRRIQKSSLDKISLITKERQKMTLSITLIWKPEDAAKTIENIRPEDIEPTFFKVIESAIKNECTKMTVEEILENSTQLEKNIKHILHSVTESWGVKVTSSNISNIVINNTEFMQNMALPKEVELEKAAKLAQIEEEKTIALKTIEKDKIAKLAELELKHMLETKKEEIETAIKEIQCNRDALTEGLRRKSVEIATQNHIYQERAAINLEAQRIKTTLMAETEGLKDKLRVLNNFSSNAISYELVKVLPDLYKNIDLGNITLFENSGDKEGGNGFGFMSNIVGSAYSIIDKVAKTNERRSLHKDDVFQLENVKE